jgi:hypothetical protein
VCTEVKFACNGRQTAGRNTGTGNPLRVTYNIARAPALAINAAALAAGVVIIATQIFAE